MLALTVYRRRRPYISLAIPQCESSAYSQGFENNQESAIAAVMSPVPSGSAGPRVEKMRSADSSAEMTLTLVST